MIKHNEYTTTSLVYKTYLGIPLEYKKKCIDTLYDLKTNPAAPRHQSFIDTFNEENKGQVVISNYHLEEEAPIFKKLLDNIVKTIKYHTLPKTLIGQYDISLASSWGGIYEEQGEANAHSHVPYYYSFVYYLKTTDQSSPMIFQGNNDLIIPVAEYLLLFFSSEQVHYVPPNKGGDRVFIAGNVEFKGHASQK